MPSPSRRITENLSLLPTSELALPRRGHHCSKGLASITARRPPDETQHPQFQDQALWTLRLEKVPCETGNDKETWEVEGGKEDVPWPGQLHLCAGGGVPVVKHTSDYESPTCCRHSAK